VYYAGDLGQIIEPEQVHSLRQYQLILSLCLSQDSGGFDQRGSFDGQVQERHVLVDTTMATNLPRVYAAGDITEYPGKVRLISVGFGEAATAVNNAATVIHPGATVFPGHSTEGAVV